MRGGKPLMFSFTDPRSGQCSGQQTRMHYYYFVIIFTEFSNYSSNRGDMNISLNGTTRLLGMQRGTQTISRCKIALLELQEKLDFNVCPHRLQCHFIKQDFVVERMHTILRQYAQVFSNSNSTLSELHLRGDQT